MPFRPLAPWRHERTAAAWLASLAAHLALCLGLVLIVERVPRPAGETLDFELHLGGGDGAVSDVLIGAPQDTPQAGAVGDAFEPGLALSVSLPPARASGASAAGGGPAPPADGNGAAQGGRASLHDFRFGYGHTKLFGVAGEGYRFVYVFDRSGSMGGSGRSALEVAKAELLASLQPLESTHQFQIVFYNELPQTFALGGRSGRLAFANESNKQAAAEYVRGVGAMGSTRHEEALAMALGMFPDVIYFLTDADEPAMTSKELRRIQRLNGERTVIHAIEFGLGPGGHRENFLTQLARENGGEHRYVDFSSWRPERRDAALPAPDAKR